MRHLGIIPDGNGRWGAAAGLRRLDGHIEGARALIRFIADLQSLDLDAATVYVFSTENIGRAEAEGIFDIIIRFLNAEIRSSAKKFGLKIRFIGDFSRLPDKLESVIRELTEETADNDGKSLIIAVGYGGVAEVCSAFNKIFRERLKLNDRSDLTPREIYDNLYTAGLPLPEAILRYGGYRRLSNFLPLQSVYSELFFTDKLWPDYQKTDIEAVLKQFSKIKRNFGG